MASDEDFEAEIPSTEKKPVYVKPRALKAKAHKPDPEDDGSSIDEIADQAMLELRRKPHAGVDLNVGRDTADAIQHAHLHLRKAIGSPLASLPARRLPPPPAGVPTFDVPPGAEINGISIPPGEYTAIQIALMLGGKAEPDGKSVVLQTTINRPATGGVMPPPVLSEETINLDTAIRKIRNATPSVGELALGSTLYVGKVAVGVVVGIVHERETYIPPATFGRFVRSRGEIRIDEPHLAKALKERLEAAGASVSYYERTVAGRQFVGDRMSFDCPYNALDRCTVPEPDFPGFGK